MVLAYFLVLVVTSSFVDENKDCGSKVHSAMRMFSRAIAHEVNSPLAAIRMMSITLRDIASIMEKGSHKVQMESGEAMYEVGLCERDYEMLTKVLPEHLLCSSQEAIRVVEVLLSVFKEGESGFVTSCSMLAIIDDAVNEVYSECENRDMKGQISVARDNDFQLCWPAQLLKRVYTSLIMNSIKHGGECVMVNVWIDGEKRVHCWDNGCGIDEENMRNLFRPVCNKHGANAGMGLTFCNVVMRSLGGDITCTSGAGGHTEFILKFQHE